MSRQKEVKIRKERRKKEREIKSVISHILSTWHCTLKRVVSIKNNVLCIRGEPG